MRTTIPPNHDWKFIKQAASADSAAAQAVASVTLPHTWNAIDGQDGGNDYYAFIKQPNRVLQRIRKVH